MNPGSCAKASARSRSTRCMRSSIDPAPTRYVRMLTNIARSCPGAPAQRYRAGATFARGTTGPGDTALAAGGWLEGFALVATHYAPMAALHVPATITYDPRLLAWSVALAVAVSTATLWFAARLHSAPQRLIVAIAMGGGLTLMHH